MHLESENLESAIAASGITIVDFYAEWCGPCKMMAPVLDRIEKEGTALVIKVDTEKYPTISKKHSVQSLPTLQFYKDGELMDTRIGAMPKPSIESLIRSL